MQDLSLSDIASPQSDYRTTFIHTRRKLKSYKQLSEKYPQKVIEKVKRLEEKWKSFTIGCHEDQDDCSFDYNGCHISLTTGLIYLDGFLYNKCLKRFKEAEEASEHFYGIRMSRMTANFFKTLFIAFARVLSQISTSGIEKTLSYIKRAHNLIVTYPDEEFEKTFETSMGYQRKDLTGSFLLLLAEGDIFMRTQRHEHTKYCYLEAEKLAKKANKPYLLFLAYSRLVLVCTKMRGDEKE